MKKILIFSTLIAATAVFQPAPPAEAAVVSNVNVVRISGYAGTSVSYIYFRSSGLDNTYNSCTTNDDTLIMLAAQSLAGPYKLQISTSGTCNTGTNSSCGTCTLIRINP